MAFFTLFLSRPVAAWLLSLAILLLGILGYRVMPVSPLPNIDLPVITVSASLSGAPPETMASSVAAPLEAALGTIAGLDEMTSRNSLGSTRIILLFSIEKNVHEAAREVQAAINAAIPMLPSGMRNPPSYRKINPADSPIMILTLTSRFHTLSELYDVANTEIAPQIAQLNGVGDVSLGGSALPAIRIKVDPLPLAHMGLGLDSVARSIASANQKGPLGAIEQADSYRQIASNGALITPEDYGEIILKTSETHAPVKLKDVSDIKASTQNERSLGMSDGQPAILMVINRSQNANIIETVDKIKTKMPDLQTSLPLGMELKVAQDRTPTIRASLNEVRYSLIVAVILVILIVFLFLRSVKSTLVPAIVVPISLIGSFSMMYFLGFSLNNLTLMALTIATGFVVDDAIVIEENIARHIEKGITPFKAALIGLKEVGFTVCAISLSLIAVFIPLLFAPGVQGLLFYEFAATLSITIFISLFISLTLTPMLSARLLTHSRTDPSPELANQNASLNRRNIFYKYLKKIAEIPLNVFTVLFNLLRSGYQKALPFALKYPSVFWIIFFVTIFSSVWLFKSLPKTLFPEQDTGRIVAFIRGDQSTSFQLMSSRLERIMQSVKEHPAVDNVSGYTGGGSANSANMFISLKPLEERAPIKEVISELQRALKDEAGATLLFRPVQDFRVGGRSANATYQFTLLSDDVNLLRKWEPIVRKGLSELKVIEGVDSDSENNGAEVYLNYHRDLMAHLDLSVSDANALINNALGQRAVSTIFDAQNQYQVILEVNDAMTENENALSQLYLVNNYQKPIPLSAVSSWQSRNAPLVINHEKMAAAATISFNLPENGSLSEASQAIFEQMVTLGVPNNIQGQFSGSAKLFQQSSQDQVILILGAIIAIYLVLGMLYESYIHPLTILSTLPSAGLGALLALKMYDTPFSLIAMIGILLLIGIVKKNAILMIDFAIKLQKTEGKTPKEAIYEACLIRFRPILMTTLAAMGGAVPLILGQGDGAELRQPLGITILGGLIVSQCLTLFTTPVIYLGFERIRKIFVRNTLTR